MLKNLDFHSANFLFMLARINWKFVLVGLNIVDKPKYFSKVVPTFIPKYSLIFCFLSSGQLVERISFYFLFFITCPKLGQKTSITLVMQTLLYKVALLVKTRSSAKKKCDSRGLLLRF